MSTVHNWGPFWCRSFRVITWLPVWFGRTTMTEGSYRSSIHPVVQVWPGRAVAFGIWGRKHDEEDGLLLAMRSFGRSRTPRTEVINPDEDGVGKARVTEDIDLFTGKRYIHGEYTEETLRSGIPVAYLRTTPVDIPVRVLDEDGREM